MLDVRLEALVSAGNGTLAQLTEAMADAAVTDLRGQEIVPTALALLQHGGITSEQNEALTLMEEWIELVAPRRDRDNDGRYDQEQAVALMDAWYPHMIEALLPQVLPLETAGLAPVGRDNAPGAMGSAYQQGYYGYLRR